MATQNVIQSELALILAKPESAYGTDPTPTEAANAIVVREFSMTTEVEMIDRSRLRPTFSSPGAAQGMVHCAFEFSCPATGSPDPDTDPLAEPDYGIFLDASGMAGASTGSPVDTWTYTPDSTSTASVTLYVYLFRDDGSADLYEINGARMGWELTGSSGDVIAWNFSGLGLYNDPAAGSPTLANVAYNEALDDAVLKGGTVTVGGTTRNISEFSIAWNREPQVRPDFTGTHGVAGIHLSSPIGQSITGSFNPELRLEATYDHLDKILGETKEALVIQWDTAGGSRVTVNAPALQQGSFSYDEDSGIWRLGQEFYLCDDADTGDDAIEVVITRTP